MPSVPRPTVHGRFYDATSGQPQETLGGRTAQAEELSAGRRFRVTGGRDECRRRQHGRSLVGGSRATKGGPPRQSPPRGRPATHRRAGPSRYIVTGMTRSETGAEAPRLGRRSPRSALTSCQSRSCRAPETGGNLPPVFSWLPPRPIAAVWSGVLRGKMLAGIPRGGLRENQCAWSKIA